MRMRSTVVATLVLGLLLVSEKRAASQSLAAARCPVTADRSPQRLFSSLAEFCRGHLKQWGRENAICNAEEKSKVQPPKGSRILAAQTLETAVTHDSHTYLAIKTAAGFYLSALGEGGARLELVTRGKQTRLALTRSSERWDARKKTFDSYDWLKVCAVGPSGKPTCTASLLVGLEERVGVECDDNDGMCDKKTGRVLRRHARTVSFAADGNLVLTEKGRPPAKVESCEAGVHSLSVLETRPPR